ncbi:hypothetical protein CABS01_09388 [Colletotrichum abscissum]|uniref:uncharacterized protein n=1 Tax=Colletotrichum abscissum TaxID=1671311 RepID=UPI0027D64322|nr:uncharacterized protein CABS01_09388 [Colletotrichum abscissum]KAK1502777.1 hypothetical protein CABS01_09388 [Colletotrichum abscissum]
MSKEKGMVLTTASIAFARFSEKNKLFVVALLAMWFLPVIATSTFPRRSFSVLSTTGKKDETNSGQKEQRELGVGGPSSFHCLPQVSQTRYVPVSPE